MFAEARANAQEAGMFATWGIAAVALAAAAFMLRFLLALLREGAPSVCYWVVPARREPKRQMVEILSSNSMDDDCWATSELPPAVEVPGNFPAVRPSRTTGTPGSPIFVRLRIERPWQS
jgi:hypothetical protein